MRHYEDHPGQEAEVFSGSSWGGTAYSIPSFGWVKESILAFYDDDDRLQLVMLCLMLLLYGPLLWISWKLSPVDSLDFTFNSMLQHLLHGHFDVDAQTVRNEGFVRDGRVYVYWGIWCALVRLPLWVVGRLDMDATVWSCLLAVCLAGMAKVRAILLLRRQLPDSLKVNFAICLMLAYILFGGSQIGYLRISVYQEVVFWAYAFAELFVYFALKGLVNHNFDLSTLNSMAVCAGLALLTRVSTGAGLLLAMALLMLVVTAHSGVAETKRSNLASRPKKRVLTQLHLLVPLAILAALIAAAGTVNYFRWGNPTTFANFGLAVYKPLKPVEMQGGTFEVNRIPFGLLYYFLPVWVLHGRDGQLVFAQTHARWFNRVEAPPSTILLTDLLPIYFIILLAVHLWKRRARYLPVVPHATALTLGLLSPCVLMLGFTSLAYRYRMEFYPSIDLLACLGLYSSLGHEQSQAISLARQRWLAAALGVSILFSFLGLSLYDLSLSVGRPHELYDRMLEDVYRVIHVLI